MKKQNNFFNLKFPDKVFGIEKYFLVLFLPPLALLIVFFISLGLIVIPRINDISNTRTNIKNVNSNIDKIVQQNKYLESIDQEELQKNTEYLNNAVLRNKQSYLLVGIVRQVANRFGYQIKSFSLVPGDVKEVNTNTNTKTSNNDLKNMIRMPVNLIMDGPKDSSLELIKALEKTLPILFIDKFETQSSNGSTEISLTIYSYYIKDEFNVNTDNISLNDLILSDEESSLLKEISTFTKIEDNQTDIDTTEFQQYDRENPFSI